MKPVHAAVLFFCLMSLSPLFADEREDLTAALREAIDDKDVAAAASLLEAGADPNGFFYTDSKQTFLMMAARSNVQLVKLLLDHGADVDARSTWGGSAAHYAGGPDIEEILSLLASKGARFDITNNDGDSPLMRHLDYTSKMAGIVFILDWEEKNSPGFTAGLKSRKDYYTALLKLLLSEYDRSSDKYPLAVRLLNAGADAAAKYDNGTPIVFTAVNYSNLGSNILSLLIQRGAPVNEADSDGMTLLMRVVDRDEPSLLTFLLSRRANPNLQDEKGKTALMYARNKEAADWLLASGADVNVQDNDGKTALLHAWLHPQIIISLLEAGADAAHTDKRGNTILHYWGYIRNANILEALLFYGCPLDQPDNSGFTPLMDAARSGHGKAVLTLLEKGADAKHRAHNGSSVLYHYLRWSKKNEEGSFLVDDDGEKLETVVAALLAGGADPAAMDDEGNSALLYVLDRIRWKDDAKYMSLLRNMMLEYASADEAKAAKAVIAEKKKKDLHNDVSENLPSTIWALSLPLIIGGLSIGMREGVFANNKSENFMGPINGGLTLGATGFFLGFVIGASTYRSSGAWADMFGPVLEGFIGGVIGFIGGVVIACLPPVRRAFTDIPALYYSATALSALTSGITIYNIWQW